MLVGNGTVPAQYDFINAYNSTMSPSTVHCANTSLTNFFARYLMQKAMSVFKWNLPETWSKNYFLYTLYVWGWVSVFETDKYGVICQGSGLEGYDIFYQPTHVVVTNPLLKKVKKLRIGRDCEVLRLTPDWGGIFDIIMYYADNMAMTAEATGMNVMNSKLSYMFSARNKAGAESLKTIMDKIMRGELAVFYDEKLKTTRPDMATTEPWTAFAQDLRSNFIAPDLQDTMRRWEELFDNEIGINNVRSDKKERLITAEAESNNFEAKSKCELWLDSLQEGCKKVNKMFGIDISVDWRVEENEPDTNFNGVVEQRT